MGLTSLQVCLDTSEWLQGGGGMHEEDEGGLMDHSSPSSGGDMMTAFSRPLVERRLRPQHDQALKCPRCDSAHTKFCYYNNYSLTQPRYFCKTCRRYWTKGGSLRNIPVGGGCRKNNKTRVSSSSSSAKKSALTSSSSSSSSTDLHHQSLIVPHSLLANSSSNNIKTTTDLQLSFPHDHHLQLSHFSTLFGNSSSSSTGLIELGNLNNNNNLTTENKYNAILDNPIRQVDFMECTKYDNIIGNPSTNHDFMSSTHSNTDDHLGNLLCGLGDHHNHGFNTVTSNFNNLNPFGISLNGNNNDDDHDSSLMMINNNSCQRLMLPFDYHHHQQQQAGTSDTHDQDPNIGFEMKPNKQLLSLDQWQDHNIINQGCSEVGKDSFGYNNNNYTSLGSWSSSSAIAMMNSYGSSQANPSLV